MSWNNFLWFSSMIDQAIEIVTVVELFLGLGYNNCMFTLFAYNGPMAN